MDFKVNITVGVTPQLESLIGGMLRTFGVEKEAMSDEKPAVKKQDPGKGVKVGDVQTIQKDDSRPAEAKETAPAEAKETAPAEAKETAPAETKETAPAEAKETAPAESEQKTTYTEEDIRQAMHECRVRFEGADYKDNPDSEGYAKYHKPLTAWFRYMAQSLGYDKPSILPVEMRRRFVEDCRGTIVGQDGNFTVSLPF